MLPELWTKISSDAILHSQSIPSGLKIIMEGLQTYCPASFPRSGASIFR